MPNYNEPKIRRIFTSDFKSQMVQLYHSGKRICDILKEYDLSVSLLDKWIHHPENSGSFKEKDNRTPEENELITLRNRISQLESKRR